jgi:hypothetical protein
MRLDRGVIILKMRLDPGRGSMEGEGELERGEGLEGREVALMLQHIEEFGVQLMLRL